MGSSREGGIHDSAVAEIAARQETLKQRITRLNKKRSRK
jgi:chaperonin cofactor prefoldin